MHVQVLQTLPWDQVDIEVILVELIHSGEVEAGTREEVHTYLQGANYQFIGSFGKPELRI